MSIKEIGFHARPVDKTPTERLEALAKQVKERAKHESITAIGGRVTDPGDRYYGHSYDWKKRDPHK